MTLLAALSTLFGPSPGVVMRDVGTGVATGLPMMAVAGPVSLLLVDVGMRRGVRTGSSAAFGVAFGDVMAALLVTLFGTAMSAFLHPVSPWFRRASAILLIGFAVHVARQLVSERRAASSDTPSSQRVSRGASGFGVAATGDPGGAPALVTVPGLDIAEAPRSRLFGGFLGLTMANPLTVIVYVGIVVGGGAGAGTFGWALGMGAASLLAHGGYLGLGHAAGSTLSPRALSGLRVFAVVLLVGFAVHLMV